MKLLEKDPAGRYASAEDLRADLRRFLEGQPVAALSGAAAAAAGAAAGVAAGATMADATVAVPARCRRPVITAPPTGLGPVTRSGAPGLRPPRTSRKRTGLYVGSCSCVLVLLGRRHPLLRRVAASASSTQQVTVPDVVGHERGRRHQRAERRPASRSIQHEPAERHGPGGRRSSTRTRRAT